MRVPAYLARPVVAAYGRTMLSNRAPLLVQRWGTEATTAAIPSPRHVTVFKWGPPIRGEWLSPAGSAADAALLYLHGGGYVIGSARTHRGLAARIARALGTPALSLDYRLAPEHPHPAALDDALAGYSKLLADGLRSSRIVIAGDSAGAGLALALAMRLRDLRLSPPVAVGMVCPWLDLVPDIEGVRDEAPREPVLSRPTLSSWAEAYTGGADASDPAISPLRGDLSNLPPLIVHSAGDDLLADDAERLVVAGARFPGCEIEHRRFDGLWHDFHAFGGLIAEADEAIEDFGKRLRARL